MALQCSERTAHLLLSWRKACGHVWQKYFQVMIRGSEPCHTLLQGIAILCAFNQLLFVWFQWYLECGLIKTLDKHWTHPASCLLCSPFQGPLHCYSNHISNISGNSQRTGKGVGSSTEINWSPSPAFCLGPLPPYEIVLLNFSWDTHHPFFLLSAACLPFTPLKRPLCL